MPKCIRIKKKSRKVCIGDMRDEIILKNRTITTPRAGSVDFTETFGDEREVAALIETKDGLETFDGVNLITTVSHAITIRFIEGITEETWVEFKGRNFDIVNVINLDERDQFLKLLCNERGSEKVRVARI